MAKYNLAGEFIIEKLKILKENSSVGKNRFTLTNLARITCINYDFFRKTLYFGTGKNLSVNNMVKIAIALRLNYEEALELINRFGSDIRFDWQPENEVYRRAIRAAQTENIAVVQEILDELMRYSIDGTPLEGEMERLTVSQYIDWSLDDLIKS